MILLAGPGLIVSFTQELCENLQPWEIRTRKYDNRTYNYHYVTECNTCKKNLKIRFSVWLLLLGICFYYGV